MSQRVEAAGEPTRGGEYVVVARRYRPQTFTDLVGQGTVSQALCNAIATERVGHAYLFTGARGVGKTSTARILAKALNCQQGPTATPCGQCDICQQIASGEDVDVLEIDGASNRGIDEIRQLRSNVGIRPSRARFKIYIIDEVHMLTKEAFNALLKTLEEPPEHVKFVFCTTEPGKIPITVLSRCQRFDFAPVKTAEIAERLRYIVDQEGAEATPEALELLARRAAGSMRDSQSLLEQLLSFVSEPITVAHIHSLLGTARDDRLQAILEVLLARDAAELLKRLDATLLEGVDAGQMAEQLVGCLRDMMVAVVGGSGDLFLFSGPSQADRFRQMGAAWGLETLLAAVQILDQAVTRMRHSTHPRILLELALVRVCELENLANLSQFVGQMVQSEGRWPATPVPAGSPSASGSTSVSATSRTALPEDADSKKKSSNPAARSVDDDSRGIAETTREPARSSATADPAAPLAPRSPSESAESSSRVTQVGSSATVRFDAPQSADPPSAHFAQTSQAAAPALVPSLREEMQRASASTRTPENRVHSNGSSAPAGRRIMSDRDESEASLEADEGGAWEPDLARPPRTSSPPSFSSAPNAAGKGVHGERSEVAVSRKEAASVAEPVADPVVEGTSLPSWTPGELKQQWRRCLDEINDMAADHAGLADSVAISGPNRLVVRFRQAYNASKSFCERPEKREVLEQTFLQLTGCRVRLEFELLKEEPKPVETPTRPVVAKSQLRQQVAKDPWVQKAIEMFEAEILNADRDERPKS